VPEFRERRNELLLEYLSNEENMKADLAYYDELHSSTKGDFYRDHAKKDTNFTFQEKVNDKRNALIANYDLAEKISKNKYTFDNTNMIEGLKFTGSFERLREASWSTKEFLANNRQFGQVDADTISLIDRENFGSIFMQYCYRSSC